MFILVLCYNPPVRVAFSQSMAANEQFAGFTFSVPLRKEFQTMVSFIRESGFGDVTIPEDLPPDQINHFLMEELQEKPMRKNIWQAISTLAEELDEVPGAEEIRDMVAQAMVVVVGSSDEFANGELGYEWTPIQAAADFLNHVHHRRHPSDAFLIDRNGMFAFTPTDVDASSRNAGRPEDWDELVSHFQDDAVEFFHYTAGLFLRYHYDLSRHCERVNHYLSEAFPGRTVVLKQNDIVAFLQAVDQAQTLPEIKSAIQNTLDSNATYMTAMMFLDIIGRQQCLS